MSDTYISHIQTARKQANLKTMVKIANALGVTVDHMLNGNQTSDPAEYMPDLAQLFDGCTSCEKRIIYEIALALNKSLQDNKIL